MKSDRSLFLAAMAVPVLAALVAGCAHRCCRRTSPVELASVPEQVVIDGQGISLSAYVWRDFMPIVPPEGPELLVAVELVSDRGAVIGLAIDRVWVRQGAVEWEAAAPADRDDVTKAVVGGGPKFETGSTVDVVVRVSRSGRTWLLRAAEQTVHRTE